MATKAQSRRAAKDRVLEAARVLVNGGARESGSGGDLAFDEHDRAAARARGPWTKVDRDKFDGLRDAVRELDR